MSGWASDPRKAIYAYNHADWYVDKVLRYADQFKNAATYVGGSSTGSKAQQVTTVGDRWIGHSTYVFGGGRNQSDINSGRFDCSSFVHWAFGQIGVNLGDLSSTSTDTLNNLGIKVPYNQAQPGDIVFFDTYKVNGHVGIYLGNGKFIGCQSSSGVAIADMTKSYWAQRFSGNVRRLIQN
ncbi:C40 family peptidase [Bacillus sp. BRMEA1]|nr:C40 family peptidase [Neobacillus endophyticus]